MNAPVLQDFSYDPFDPAVMADPLPYYRVLRDEHPVYFIEKWDTYALSRFSDIWQVLEMADGTFVASEGTLPAATVLAQRNDGPVPDPPLHPMPFHANFDAPIYDGVRCCTSGPFRPKSVSQLANRIRTLANERLDELLPRGTFDLTQEYGGIVAASVVCELLGLPVDLAPDVLATVNAGSLAQPGSGVEVGNARPGYLEYLVPIVRRRRADSADGGLPIADKLIDYRLPDGSAFNDIEAATQMLGCSSEEPKPCRRSSLTDCGSWAGGPTNLPLYGPTRKRMCPSRARRWSGTARPRSGSPAPCASRSPSTARQFNLVSASSRCSHRPTVTRGSTPIPTTSLGIDPSSACWPSAVDSISAWVSISHESRSRSW